MTTFSKDAKEFWGSVNFYFRYFRFSKFSNATNAFRHHKSFWAPQTASMRTTRLFKCRIRYFRTLNAPKKLSGTTKLFPKRTFGRFRKDYRCHIKSTATSFWVIRHLEVAKWFYEWISKWQELLNVRSFKVSYESLRVLQGYSEERKSFWIPVKSFWLAQILIKVYLPVNHKVVLQTTYDVFEFLRNVLRVTIL